MKIIVNESRLNNLIIKYFNQRLMPTNLNYFLNKKDSGTHDSEYFFWVGTGHGEFNDEYIWYSSCKDEFDENIICPFVMLPKSVQITMDNLFGDLWKPLFKEWFGNLTGLPINSVEDSNNFV